MCVRLKRNQTLNYVKMKIRSQTKLLFCDLFPREICGTFLSTKEFINFNVQAIVPKNTFKHYNLYSHR